jgi:hypothetical protein
VQREADDDPVARCRRIDILERLFAISWIAPEGSPRVRAIQRAQERYHWDWTLVQAPGPWFGNPIASRLHGWMHRQQDAKGRDCELGHSRDVDGRAVDVAVVDGRQPVPFFECKPSHGGIDPKLRNQSARFPKVPARQVSSSATKDRVSPKGIRGAPALTLLPTRM